MEYQLFYFGLFDKLDDQVMIWKETVSVSIGHWRSIIENSQILKIITQNRIQRHLQSTTSKDIDHSVLIQNQSDWGVLSEFNQSPFEMDLKLQTLLIKDMDSSMEAIRTLL